MCNHRQTTFNAQMKKIARSNLYPPPHRRLLALGKADPLSDTHKTRDLSPVTLATFHQFPPRMVIDPFSKLNSGKNEGLREIFSRWWHPKAETRNWSQIYFQEYYFFVNIIPAKEQLRQARKSHLKNSIGRVADSLKRATLLSPRVTNNQKLKSKHNLKAISPFYNKYKKTCIIKSFHHHASSEAQSTANHYLFYKH